MGLGSLAGSRKVSLGQRMNINFDDPETKKKIGNLTQGVSLLGNAASIGFDASNTDYNLQYGKFDRTIADAVGGAISPIYSAVAAVGDAIGSAWNKSNKFDKYGYNHAGGFQRNAYYAAGGAADPFSNLTNIMSKGGEGSGYRSLVALFNPIGGSLLQQKADQERGLERRKTAETIEDSNFELNKFIYNPTFDV